MLGRERTSEGDVLRSISAALKALGDGDKAIRLPQNWPGVAGEVADAFNRIAAQRSADNATDGARAPNGVSNGMRIRALRPAVRTRADAVDGGALTSEQAAAVLSALRSVRHGDETVRLPLEWPDLAGRIAETFNDVVELNGQLQDELKRLSRVAGKEGRLKERARPVGTSGFWLQSIESVNALVEDLVRPTREIARVIGAVAQGDLTKSMTLEVEGRALEGESLRTARTINTMVDQLRAFAAEVTRVAREVGTEGKLGGQADVQGVSGTWRDLTDSVNSMAGNLTAQVRNIAEVTTAVARGDLSKKITVDVKGELLELKSTINTMVDQLSSFASEVTRVAREVGTEGKLGGEADVQGVSGTWRDLTENVNLMAGNLTAQVRNIAEVTTAVARGDLSKKITVDVKGELLELKGTINTMVDQLRAFAAEVTRVAREVGTEGKLGGQADVPGVAGTWKTLTDSVNSMAGNLTAQVRNIADVTTAVARGDLSKKITVDVKGEILELKGTINTMVDQLRSFAAEVTRVAREVGTEGKLGGQADVQGVAGTWRDLTENVNSMAGNLTDQVRNIAEVTKAVAAGDLSRKITVDVKGEILELKATINTMVDQLRSFAAEVTRVAREVGTEGKLGGQADVPGVAGTWKDLTDSVNSMAGNLTAQVRGIARVVTAVADGDLKHKLTVEAKGEIASLADTINGMTETLAIFADQVTTVAREVGVEGQLGGQAKVPGAAGTWKALTENVNQLAANLTTQVRAIAEVATAVTKGDLTRTISVGAEGEVAALKDTINEMIRNLRDTTQKNNEQNWLKTNLAKFSRMLQGQKDLNAVSRMILSELAPVVGAHQAEVYVYDSRGGEPFLRLLASYAADGESTHGKIVELGAGLVGQCARDKRRIMLDNVRAIPIRISTGLVDAPPVNVLVLPIVFEGVVKGVLELASLERFNPAHHDFLDQLTESIGLVINTIEANMRTEDLLAQSQSLAKELQQTNAELQEKARLLAYQNQEVERKNTEVEQARQDLEDKAEQLARTSKYKSEFLANMSHELRTPLNSLLILSDQLCQNRDGNLTERQVEFSKTIHASGNDLLILINDILDLAKIESGTVAVDACELRFDDLYHYVNRTFRHIAEQKNLIFEVKVDPRLPSTMVTDAKRLQQILQNLLSNAFKFTKEGEVSLTIEFAEAHRKPQTPSLEEAGAVVAFVVSDTGIGISAEKQSIIFEAFQQADGSTSRKYGGTGLGLAISRELSRLLGGEIELVSSVGEGSSFALYLPLNYVPFRTARRGGTASSPAEREATSGDPAFLPAPEMSAQAASGAVAANYVTATGEISPTMAAALAGKKVLIVDDDARNIFALAAVLEDYGMDVLSAGSGREALKIMSDTGRLDIVLMDIMMPDMDGMATIRAAREIPSCHDLPIIAVTAQALKGDRERCIEAGAWDYLAKPVDASHLLSVMRSWLYR